VFPPFLVVSDLDGTLTEAQSGWQFVMEQLGLWENYGKIHLNNFLNKTIDYKEFIRLDVKTWQGLPESHYIEIINRIPFRSGVENLFSEFKALGGYIVLLSTGLMDVATRAKRLFPVDKVYANKIHKENGFLSGKYTEVVGWHGKERIIKTIRMNFPNIPIIGLGDTDGDIPIIENSAISFACFSQSDKLNNIATYKIENLESILPLVKEWIPNI